ncbi:MAG: metallophosphoesterase [Deltaproteobacteria bacterium]|jgi:hypothetical protein|nr:metallophosphoesterase [Deltaproteobacteria bacterium]MBW2532068.1 metallophosphoesterase [Deltaproteobacteria bacterium]
MDRFIASALCAALLAAATSSAMAGPASAHHGRGARGVFWFTHLSDTHIGASDIVYPDSSDHFELALEQIVPVIDPAFVVVTGDLCNGSAMNIPTSGPSQAEWDTYARIVGHASMTDDFYFDVPGNHDGYGDVGLGHYLENSVQGRANGVPFFDWVVTTPVSEHYFFGLSSAGEGSQPLIEAPEFTEPAIEALEAGLLAHGDADTTFVFAHHPLHVPERSAQVAGLLRDHGGAYYLHGHRHEYTEYADASRGIVSNEVDTLGKGDVSNIGVGVIDHGALIYRARNVLSPWPFVVISAPMHRYLRGTETPHPGAYDVCLDRPDNPFRAVVFAPQAPSRVLVEVGTLIAPSAMTLVDGTTALWQAELDTRALPPGPHHVTVTAFVGDAQAQHTVTSTFAPGPCAPLPDDDPSASDVPPGQGSATWADARGGAAGGDECSDALLGGSGPQGEAPVGCHAAPQDSSHAPGGRLLPTAVLCLAWASRRRKASGWPARRA